MDWDQEVNSHHVSKSLYAADVISTDCLLILHQMSLDNSEFLPVDQEAFRRIVRCHPNFCRICNAAEFLGLDDFTATRSITFQEFADLLETHEAIAPPSMSIIVPVTNSFSSRKIAAAATSSAVPACGIICPDVPF